MTYFPKHAPGMLVFAIVLYEADTNDDNGIGSGSHNDMCFYILSCACLEVLVGRDGTMELFGI